MYDHTSSAVKVRIGAISRVSAVSSSKHTVWEARRTGSSAARM
jgi:hypothetical protein